MSVGRREDLHERFRRVVARGLERAEREHAEHLARIRAIPMRRANFPGHTLPKRA